MSRQLVSGRQTQEPTSISCGHRGGANSVNRGGAFSVPMESDRGKQRPGCIWHVAVFPMNPHNSCIGARFLKRARQASVLARLLKIPRKSAAACCRPNRFFSYGGPMQPPRTVAETSRTSLPARAARLAGRWQRVVHYGDRSQVMLFRGCAGF